MTTDIDTYNKKISGEEKKIAELLKSEIDKALPKAESKLFHSNPAWFLEGNPVVGYSKLKDCIQLLFWSGQSFEEEGLKVNGSFKAAEKRYTKIEEVSIKDLKRWLKKSKEIQWDYKNIVKRKGKLERLV